MAKPTPCERFEERLSSYLLGDLPAAEAVEVKAHLDGCPACQATVRELEPTLAILRKTLAAESAKAAAPPPVLEPARRLAIRDAHRQPRTLRFRLLEPFRRSVGTEDADALTPRRFSVIFLKTAAIFAVLLGILFLLLPVFIGSPKYGVPRGSGEVAYRSLPSFKPEVALDALAERPAMPAPPAAGGFAEAGNGRRAEVDGDGWAGTADKRMPSAPQPVTVAAPPALKTKFSTAGKTALGADVAGLPASESRAPAVEGQSLGDLSKYLEGTGVGVIIGPSSVPASRHTDVDAVLAIRADKTPLKTSGLYGGRSTARTLEPDGGTGAAGAKGLAENGKDAQEKNDRDNLQAFGVTAAPTAGERERFSRGGVTIAAGPAPTASEPKPAEPTARLKAGDASGHFFDDSRAAEGKQLEGEKPRASGLDKGLVVNGTAATVTATTGSTVGGAGGTSALSREERVNAALQARRKILEYPNETAAAKAPATETTEESVPLVGDVPVPGRLFRQTENAPATTPPPPAAPQLALAPAAVTAPAKPPPPGLAPAEIDGASLEQREEAKAGDAQVLVAAETPSADILFGEALTGNFTKKREMLLQRDALLPLVDATLAGAQHDDRAKGMAIELLVLLAEGDPKAVFTSDRTDLVSRMILTSSNWGLKFAVVDFIAKAADSGMLGNRQPHVDRLRAAFQRNPEVGMGMLLVALAPTDPTTLSAVRAAKRMLSASDERLLLAAAGAPPAIRELVDLLELDNPANDERLHDQRAFALMSLRRVRDCRAVSALIEVLSKPWWPPAATGDMLSDPLAHSAMKAFTETLKVYPDIIAREKLPGTPKEVTEWWEKDGKNLAGLDIRKSTKPVWQRKLPGLDVPSIEPVLDPSSPEAVAKRVARDQRDWDRAADAIAAASPDGNALEFYRQAVRTLGPSKQTIPTLFAKALANELGQTDYVELAKLIAENGPALAAIKKGLACRKCDTPPLPDAKRSLPFLPQMFVLHRLQLLNGKLLEHDGRAQDALACYLDGIGLARHIGAGRLSVEAAASLSAERNACQCISRTLATTALPVGCYSWLCGKLYESGDSPVSVVGTIDEGVSILRRSCEVMTMNDLAEEIAKGMGMSVPPPDALTPVKDLLTSLDAYQQAIHAWLQLTYREARRQPMPEPQHWVARNWLPNAGALWLLQLRTACDRRAVLLAAAILSYNAKEGRLPARLSDLTPRYVNALPLDPFTAEPFLFVRRPAGFRVYSLGPNLTDDHGAAPGKQRGSWETPSPGDVVYDYDLPTR